MILIMNNLLVQAIWLKDSLNRAIVQTVTEILIRTIAFQEL